MMARECGVRFTEEREIHLPKHPVEHAAERIGDIAASEAELFHVRAYFIKAKRRLVGLKIIDLHHDGTRVFQHLPYAGEDNKLKAVRVKFTKIRSPELRVRTS